MAQFKVPQDVQRADTIIGPLTMSGLIIVISGGGFAYLLFLYVAQPVGPVMAFIVAAITAAFALVRMHDMSFAQFLMVITLYLLKPRLRVWEKGSADIPLSDRLDASPVKVVTVKENKVSNVPVKKFTSLQELTQVLDTDGQSDIDEAHEDEFVPTAFGVNSKKK